MVALSKKWNNPKCPSTDEIKCGIAIQENTVQQ